MFQNAAIDVAIALILMYLMLSLLCTTINEFIATKLKLRAKSLASALEQLLDDNNLYNNFYLHGLVVTNKRATAVAPQSTASGVASVASAVTYAASATTSSVKNMISPSAAVAPAPPAPPKPTPVAPATPPAAPALVAAAPAPPPEQHHPSYLSSRTVALALIGSLDPTKPLPGM